MALTKTIFSTSVNGKNQKVVATGTPGTTIHICSTNSLQFEEVWLWAQNSDTTDRKLTIEFGSTTAPDDTIEVTIPAESGPMLVIPGWLLNNSLQVRAFAATANVVLVNGFVFKGVA